jgi:hypothetical protein
MRRNALRVGLAIGALGLGLAGCFLWEGEEENSLGPDESACVEGFACPGEPAGPNPVPGSPGSNPLPSPGYTVTARPATSGAIRITSEPARIDCLNNDNTQGDRCVEGFPMESRVRLIATVQQGHTFVQWDGGPCNGGTGTDCIIAVLSGPVTTSARSAPSKPITWTGAAGSSDWGTAGNWDPQQVPTRDDDVLVNATSISPTITQATGDAVVARLEVNGSLVVAELGGLSVLNDIRGTGSLEVQSRGRVAVAQASQLGTLAVSGQGEVNGPSGVATFDGAPILRVQQASFSTVASLIPILTSLQLEIASSITLSGNLNAGSRATVRILPSASMAWQGSLAHSLGGGGLNDNCRLQNQGQLTAEPPEVNINCQLENSGTITVAERATFSRRGVNRGTIRFATAGGTRALQFRGQVGDAPHWRFEASSIVEENITSLTIEGGSVVEGRLSTPVLVLTDAAAITGTSHVVALAPGAVNQLTSSARQVELRFGGVLSLDRLTVSGVLALPADPSVLLASEATLNSGTVLQGGILEAVNVRLGSSTFSAPIILDGRLRVTGLAAAGAVTVLGRAGTLELPPGSTLDLDPGGGAVASLLREGTSNSVLKVENRGLIRKRGAGAGEIQACFPDGVGNVANQGSGVFTIVELTC